MKNFFALLGLILVIVGIIAYLYAAFQHWDTPEAMVSPHQKLEWYGPAVMIFVIGGILVRLNDD